MLATDIMKNKKCALPLLQAEKEGLKKALEARLNDIKALEEELTKQKGDSAKMKSEINRLAEKNAELTEIGNTVEPMMAFAAFDEVKLL